MEAASRFVAIGMKPGRIVFGHQGGFAVVFDEMQVLAHDDVDTALTAFEASHGDR